MAGKSGGGGGNPTILAGGDLKKPLNLLSAISEIKMTGALERGMEKGKGGDDGIDSDFLSPIFRLDFFSIGLRNSLLNGLVAIFLTPLTLGVFYKLIPVFNDTHISLFDKIYVLIFNFSLSIGFGIFLSSVKNSYNGNMSKGMIRSLLGGFSLGELVKVILIFILFNWIYLKMNTKNIYHLCLFLRNRTIFYHGLKNINYVHVFYWLMNFRGVFPVSAVLVLLSSVAVIGIPLFMLNYNNSNFKKKK
jgi:hypothetical protein